MWQEWSIVVGEVVAPHGIRGALRTLPLTEAAGRFAVGQTLCLVAPDGARRRVEVLRSTPHQQFLLIEIAGCATRNDAELLRGAVFTITEAMRAPLPEGRYYHSDLLGMRVVTTDGREVGVITDILETGSNDVFVTERALIPATKEVVIQVDVAGKVMVVNAVAGLLEEDAG